MMRQELSKHELAKSVIGTRRLVLRPLREGDAAAIYPLFNDWDVVRYLAMPPWPYALKDAEDFVRLVTDPANVDAEITFAITLNDKLIGTIGVREKPRAELDRDAPSIGYWLGKKYWGQGYMTEALRAMIAHVFALTRVDAVHCGAFADNVGSLRVQEKAGFVRAADTILFSRPTGHELAHVNTVLTRASYERLAA
jgi:RimJ/RimL family protein N-acetyltransferase